jgi:hypothetical protein
MGLYVGILSCAERDCLFDFLFTAGQQQNRLVGIDYEGAVLSQPIDNRYLFLYDSLD